MRTPYLALWLVGCTELPVSTVVKPPLQSQCQRLPIKGCGELVDGVLLYVQGDKPGAMQKLTVVKQENTPADLERFGKALRATAEMPGASGVAGPLNQVADLLDSTGKQAAPAEGVVGVAVLAPPSAPARSDVPTPTSATLTIIDKPREHDDLAARALSASADANRIVSESYGLSAKEGRVPCKVAGLDAICFKGREGPLLVTDVIGASACTDRLFIGATESDTPDFGFHWSFEARATAVTGARFAVRGGEWLYFAIVPGKKGLSESAECQIAWSGFRPWIVPGMTAGGEGTEWHQSIERH
jgi:hypothetical protein